MGCTVLKLGYPQLMVDLAELDGHLDVCVIVRCWGGVGRRMISRLGGLFVHQRSGNKLRGYEGRYDT